jgi:uncharacterized protein (DUF169 family)
MKFKEEVVKLKNILKLQNTPVAVVFSDTSLNLKEEKEFVCRGIKRASEGESFCFTKKNTLCEIGSYYLGFSGKPKNDEYQLVEKEKIFSSYLVARSFYLNTPPPPKELSKFVYILPLEKTTINPDLILIVAIPIQVSQIVGLLAYTEGAIGKTFIFGPCCQMAIAAPLVNNKISISFLDFGSRCEAGFKNEEVVVSLTLKDFLTILENSKYSKFAKQI